MVKKGEHAALFQFTPLREGRPRRLLISSNRNYFNSRPSARGDYHNGANVNTSFVFQFTPLREGRRRCWEKEPTREEFQFTPLREGRPRRVGSAERWLYHFNSRPSARGDLALVASTIGFGISIHAPPRGATWRWSPPPSALVFQFTPLREGRLPLGFHPRLD